VPVKAFADEIVQVEATAGCGRTSDLDDLTS
jgi:hypothetical protein